MTASPPPASSPDQPLKAILLMVTALMLFTVMDALSKLLAADYHPMQVVWVRYLFMTLLMAPAVAVRWPQRPLRSRHPLRQVLRGACIVGAGLLFVSGLTTLPLAQATATAFVAPMFVTALSIPLLGEQVGIRRWAAVVVGFAGVLVIVRPASSSFEPAAIFPILSAATWALGMVITRRMGLADPPLTTVMLTSMVGVVGTGVPAVWLWREPTLAAWGLMLVCGGLSVAAQMMQVRAFGFGSASMLAPFAYTSIVGSTALGVLLWGQFPDLWTWVGAAIVIASGVYTWHRERVRARERAASGP